MAQYSDIISTIQRLENRERKAKASQEEIHSNLGYLLTAFRKDGIDTELVRDESVNPNNWTIRLNNYKIEINGQEAVNALDGDDELGEYLINSIHASLKSQFST